MVSGSASSTSAGSFSEARHIEKIRYWTNEDYTRIAIYVSGPVKFQHHTLPPDPLTRRPARIYMDLKNCVLSPEMKPRIPIEDGFLRGVRVGQFRPDQARVVLDIDSIENFKVFVLSDPFRLLVDVGGRHLVKTAGKSSSGRASGEKIDKRESSAPSEPEVPPVSHFAVKMDPEIRRIVVDPGHGGRDPGAVGPSGVREKDVVLGIARNLKAILESEVGAEVVLTRADDRFLSLEERTAFANTRNADLFVSLHVNAHKDENVHGIETYYLNVANDAEAARVAAFENAVSTKELNDLEMILQDLMFNSKITESSQLAGEVQSHMVEALTREYEGVRDLGVKHGPFYVLVGARMPSILIETAFISNEKEEKSLSEKVFQQTLASGIARGIESYIQQVRQVALRDVVGQSATVVAR